MGALMTTSVEVSVIIPCYCCSETLDRALDSVLSQSALPKEIILVDDCSDDGNKTLAVMSSFKESNPHIIVKLIVLEKNSGPGSARNAGWELATSPYVAFLDADDSWHPKKLEIQSALMRSHPEVDLTGHATLNLSKDIAPHNLPPLQPEAVSRVRLLLSNFLPMRSIMLKTSLVERFYPGKRQAEDYLLWLTLACSGKSLVFLNLPLSYSYKNDFGQGGLSANLAQGLFGVLDVFKQLKDSGKIGYSLYIGLSTLELFKYVRRVVICFYYARFRRFSA
jgi:glycosyltransferase involved in cell wall biosynthesis